MIDAFLLDPIFYISFITALLFTGAAAGILAGLLGVGGGIVIVPVLFLLFPFLDIAESVRMHLAVGTSLATIIPTAIMSARAHYKKGGVDVDLLKTWGPAIFVGVLVGGYLGGGAKGSVLTLIFAIVAILVSINMVFRKEGSHVSETLPKGILRGLLGFIIGGFSVVMGIGGGTLSVPILTSFNYPIRRAVGTASAIGFIIAVPGTISFILSGLGHVDLPPGSFGFLNILGFCSIVPATMITAPIGAKIAHTINPAMLRKAFAFFLFLTSMRMFYSVFMG
jgi:uncharacterized protein